MGDTRLGEVVGIKESERLRLASLMVGSVVDVNEDGESSARRPHRPGGLPRPV